MNRTAVSEQTLALAGVAQCAELVQGLARTGKIDLDHLSVCVKSLFAFEAETTADVYEGIVALRKGLQSVDSRLFNPASPADSEIMRYTLQLIQLAKKIKNSAQSSDQLGNRLRPLEFAHEQLEQFTVLGTL